MLSRPKHSSTPERSFPLLTAKAEAILKSDTMWLDDSHMHAAQTLLKCAFPMQNGLQVLSAHVTMYVMHITSLSLCIAHYPLGEEVRV